jgi:hypothetical protein
MKKLIVLTAVICTVLVGCSADKEGEPNKVSSSPTSTTSSSPTALDVPKGNDKGVKVLDSFDPVLKALKDNGYTVGTPDTQLYQMIGAIDGIGVDVNDNGIELYKYDQSKIPDAMKENFEKAKTSEIFDEGDPKGSAIVNGNIMIVFPGPDVHPEKEKITKIFKALK